MMLILVRHGEAHDAGAAGAADDASRAITAEGIEKTRRTARALRELDCVPERIVSSPLLRAVQTAEILARALDIRQGRVRHTDALLPEADALRTIRWLADEPDAPTLLVGHLPSLSALACALICGDARESIRLRKSSACCLSVERPPAPGCARLEWLIQPSITRWIGR